MNVKTSIALAATLLLASNAHAGPQTASKPMDHSKMKMDHASMQMPATPEARAKMANTMFDKIDTNKDGQISRAEFDAHHAGMKGEGKGGHGMGMGGHRDGMEMFERADANADGKLTLAEASAKVLDMFDKADANKDGTVTPEERRAAMMAWMDSHRDHVHGDPHVDEKK